MQNRVVSTEFFNSEGLLIATIPSNANISGFGKPNPPRDSSVTKRLVWNDGTITLEQSPSYMRIYRLAWRDGIVKELQAISIDEAICLCQKGEPYTWTQLNSAVHRGRKHPNAKAYPH